VTIYKGRAAQVDKEKAKLVEGQRENLSLKLFE